MTSHVLAKVLLKHPDLPVAVYANGHVYMTACDTISHGPLRVGQLETYGGPHVVIGNPFEKHLNPPNWWISKWLE